MNPHRSLLTRRDALQRTGLGLVVPTLVQALAANGEASAAQTSRPSPLNRFPRMVQRFYEDHVNRIARGRRDQFALMRTAEDARRHVASVRRRIAEAFGPMPERTPMRPRITGTLRRDGYRVEKLIFESRPDFLVTANLYVPEDDRFNGPRPGVVGTCGHATDGKAAPLYQSFSQGLVRQGYVVLIYDPIGQGERFQYLNEDLSARFGPGVREHLIAGNQQSLVGEFLGSWRAWDGIRALDYLITRPEVDPDRIGVTGNSGGGTLTTWLAGLEDRWAMAAPSCFVTTFARNLQNELPADIEQCPPRALALGLDHEDFLAALAPRPVILLAKERDYFDVRGSEEAYARLRKLYAFLDAEENVAIFVGPTEHGYSQENREAMYGWFNRATGTDLPSDEPTLALEPIEQLHCTERGQVGVTGSRRVFDFTRDVSIQLRPRRAESICGRSRVEIVKMVRNALRLPPTANRPRVPDYRILRPVRDRSYPAPHATTYAIRTEPGIEAIVIRLSDVPHYSRPPRSDEPAVLYVANLSSDAELRDEPLVAELIPEALGRFYAVDLRGLGDSRPDTCGPNSFLTPYGSDYFYAAHGLMLDQPVPSQRTLDLIHVLSWLSSLGHPSVHLVAKGWGAVPATFAGLLAITPKIERVTLKNALTSYADLAESEAYAWPLSSLVPDILKHVDLPDIYDLLRAEKKLELIDPLGPNDSAVG